MSWLAGSLVIAMVTTVVLSSSEVEPRLLQHSATDDDDVRSEVADMLDTQKRPWRRNNVAVRDRRSTAGLGEDEPELDKRRWGQKNMALWGKRSYDDEGEQWDNYPLTKRRWGQKHMAIWGKRADADTLKFDADQLEALKRKWGQKSMALWG